jgi:hypothetical protein
MAPASSSSIALQSQSWHELMGTRGSSVTLTCAGLGIDMSMEVGVVGGVESGDESGLDDVLDGSVSGQLKKSRSSPSSSLRL